MLVICKDCGLTKGHICDEDNIQCGTCGKKFYD